MVAHEPAVADGDAQLTRRVVNYLAQQQRPALRRVHVECSDGCVLLRGRLPSFYEKQLCLSACQRVAGVLRIVDELKVH